MSNMAFESTINLDEVEEHGRDGAVKGLFFATEHVLQVSNTRVPIEEGTLERSGVASQDEGTLTGAVVYDTVYAVAQHEELNNQHSDGRQAKYLESSFNSETATVKELIAREIRAALGTD